MDNYKDKYDSIVNKLIELSNKERMLDNIETEIEINLDKRSVCKEELEELDDKKYTMRNKVATDKGRKCFIRMLILTTISAMVCVLATCLLFKGPWMMALYLISGVFIYRNVYSKKMDDYNYLYSDLENSAEYKNLLEQIDSKKKELNQLSMEDEKLTREVCGLHSEIEYLHTMIYGVIDEEEIQREIEESLKKGAEIEIKHAEKDGLIRRRIKGDRIKVMERDELY